MWIIFCIILCNAALAENIGGKWFWLGQNTLCSQCSQCDPYDNADGFCSIDRECDQIKFDTNYVWSPDGTLTNLYIAVQAFVSELDAQPYLPMVTARSVLIEVRNAAGHFAKVYNNKEPVNCTVVQYAGSSSRPARVVAALESAELIQTKFAAEPSPPSF